MNPFLVAFTLMGFIYICIGVWALAIHSMGALGICAVGFLICVAGHRLSARLLN